LEDSHPDSKAKKANHLIHEKSPYLIQHAHNPVDWYPWGDDAFRKARTGDKPIFLSIGYSSCHWCHVMAHESFEDPEVAKILNDDFVSIKVDREERPDVDEIYLKSVQSMTGSGGWPLSVFLTPCLEPFYGGTYFPPEPRYGVPGFGALLRSIAKAWKSDREKIKDSASQMKSALIESYKTLPSSGVIDNSVFDACFDELAHAYDQEYGGFGVAPKFPTPSNLFFLSRYHKSSGEKTPLSMLTRTLDSMSSGGIYDQLGGGFHRYSTDRMWLIPHFEKMLYDNALLVIAYTEGYLLTENANYRRRVDETLSWVLREMRSPEGAFFSAQDADSPLGEGAYYTWTPESMGQALSNSDEFSHDSREALQLVLKYYHVTKEGNFEDESSILTSSSPLNEIAQELGMDESTANSLLEQARGVLLRSRSARPRPLTDDKILTSWNGMMISAMSKAYQVFKSERHLSAAISAADFILSRMTLRDAQNGRWKLMRRYRGGEVKEEGVLEDYAYFGNSLVDTYESSFDSKYLRSAIEICNAMIAEFYDESNGGFFEAAKDEVLIARPKQAFDGAVPSGNSVAALFCLRIGEIASDEVLKKKAERTFRAFWNSIEFHPSSHTEMIVALDFFLHSPKEIVISGDLDNNETVALIDEVRKNFVPNSVLLFADPALEKDIPLFEGRVSGPGQEPSAYVCTNFTCKLPSKTPQELSLALKN
jgi:uncharacterized protein YyaL (SSP411 family)